MPARDRLGALHDESQCLQPLVRVRNALGATPVQDECFVPCE